MNHEESGPERLIASADDVLLRQALRAGEAELPTADQLAVVAAKLGPILGGIAGGGGTPPPAGPGSGGAGPAAGGATGAKGALVGAKIASALGLGVAVAGVVGYMALAPRPPNTPLPRVNPTATQVATAPTAPLNEPAATATPPIEPSPPISSVRIARPATAPVRPSPTAPPPAASASTASPPATSVASESEVRMLQRAQDTLRAEPSQALAICDDHARRYPNGLLSQEREVMAIDALTRLGRSGDARARAHRFREAHPSSSHLGRIEVLVGKDF